VPATVTSMTPRRAKGQGATAESRQPRRRFRDSPRLILVGIGVLAAFLAAMLVAANRLRFAPELFTEFVLYALIAVDVTMLGALAFVLARNLVKLVVERRRALPFARFRSKLVAVLMAMTVVPAVLVLIVGSELISQNLERWFNAPMDEILSSANQIASDYYRERQLLVTDHANRIAGATVDAVFLNSDDQPLRDVLSGELASQKVRRIAIYRVQPDGALAPAPAVDVASSTMPEKFDRSVVNRLAAQALAGSTDIRATESLGTSGELLHAAAVIRSPQGRPGGVVVATDYLTGDVAARSRRMTQAFESYSQMRVLKRPLTGLYLSFFLMVTLFILVGSLWMGSYLAKRITRPVSALAAAAREIGAGHLDQRVEPQSNDEFGSLVEAFNTMAGELATSRRRVERSTFELERKHVEVENRRRYIETILERITTGIVSVDADGRVTTINSAASRLLTLDRAVVGQSARAVFVRQDLQPLGALLADGNGAKTESAVREIPVLHGGQELQLAVVTTTLVGDSGEAAGRLLVLDDVTPLIRAQKVAAWREVARRLAHEIKNPLTPIQLSAERMRRHFAERSANDRALVDECAATIVGEVESLKGLVDEFSQFARMPSPRTVPTDVSALITDTLALYDGIFADVAIVTRFSHGVPLVRLDVEQVRRVIINLVDNAIEAMERKGEIVVETAVDEVNRVMRIVVADNGPGIPAGEREKLFLPYYSTKRRGSGLGLAIVRRIIAEHGGSIEVGDNTPHGTRFTIELPS
jgi:two-component system nitrogen regulation sensor histidine kinase NtrY